MPINVLTSWSGMQVDDGVYLVLGALLIERFNALTSDAGCRTTDGGHARSTHTMSISRRRPSGPRSTACATNQGKK